jgi:hypothetical protein
VFDDVAEHWEDLLAVFDCGMLLARRYFWPDCFHENGDEVDLVY